MANIREVFIVEDRFSSAFTRYLSLADKVSGATNDIRASLLNIETATAASATAMQDLADKFSNTTQKSKGAGSELDSLTRKITGLAGAYVGLQGVKSLFNLSDTISQTNARLDLMNEKFKTSGDLNKMIYQSAMRSRAAYQSTADFVSKLGTLAGNAFDSGKELVDFAEQINKQITLSGTSAQAADAAIQQLTQGLSSGALRGDELRSVLEQTPMIAQTIASYLNMSTGEMQEFASEGKLTAEIVKNAMLGAAKDTNEKFNKIPWTWSQVWAVAQNVAIKALNPVLTAISWIANNIQIIGPLVAGLGTAFAVFLVAANWINICAAATKALEIAQKMMGAAMATAWALPLIVIALVVGALYGIVAAYNKVTGASVSATGIIAGAVATLAAFIYNTAVAALNAVIQLVWTIFGEPFMGLIEFVLNAANGGFNSFGDAVANLVGNIISWFLSLGKVVTTIIDAIFNTNWTAGLSSLQSKVISWGKNENAITLDRNVNLFDRVAYSDAFSAGYNWGSNLFSSDLFDIPAATTSAATSPYSDLAGDVSSIAGDVGSIEKSVNMADEDLKSLVDMAERRYVNNINLTAQTPVINITGQNTGNTAADRRALANAIKDILVEQVAAGSVRTTARAF